MYCLLPEAKGCRLIKAEMKGPNVYCIPHYHNGKLLNRQIETLLPATLPTLLARFRTRQASKHQDHRRGSHEIDEHMKLVGVFFRINNYQSSSKHFYPLPNAIAKDRNEPTEQEYKYKSEEQTTKWDTADKTPSLVTSPMPRTFDASIFSKLILRPDFVVGARI